MTMKLTDNQFAAAHRTVDALLLADGTSDFESLWTIATALQRLEYLARVLRRRYEYACNYEVTEAQERRVDKITAEVDAVAATLAKHTRAAITIEHNRDPRGSSVKIHAHFKARDMYRTIYFG